jgi:hypothetical protein
MQALYAIERYLSPMVAPKPPTNVDIGGYLQWGFQTGVILAGVLAAFFLVIHGFRYMLTDNLSNKSELRKKIYNVVLGLVLALASYAILNAINPNLLRLDALKSFGGGQKLGGEKDASTAR